MHISSLFKLNTTEKDSTDTLAAPWPNSYLHKVDANIHRKHGSHSKVMSKIKDFLKDFIGKFSFLVIFSKGME